MAIDLSPFRRGSNTATKPRKFDELKAALLGRAEDVCRHLYPLGRRDGNEWCVGSANGERGGSFRINLEKGVFCEFNGGHQSGDLIDLWVLARSIEPIAAYDEAAEWLGWETGKPKTTILATAPQPWVPSATPAQLEAKEQVEREVSDIAQRPHIAKPKPSAGWRGAPPRRLEVVSPPPPVQKDSDDKWWPKVEPIRYQYVDADGELFVTVLRRDNPDANHPENKDVRLESKCPPGPRPLYRLAEVLRSPSVYLVEGEKCVEALRALGYTATTSLGGASAVSKTDWTPLRGRDVIRWADNDAAGEKWTRETAAELVKVGVKSIRDVVIPSGKSEGWDCADATGAEVRILIEGASQSPPIEIDGARQPAAPAGRTLTILSADDAYKDIENDYLVKKLIEPGCLSVWYGPPGSSKTFLIQYIAHAIAQGRSIFGRRVRQATTLYIGVEGGGGIRRRVRALHETYGVADRFHYCIDQVALLDADRCKEEDIDAVVKAILTCGARMVVIDTLNGVIGGGEENNSSTMGALISACKSIAQRTGAHVALVHHCTKAGTDGGPRGHGSLEAAVDVAVAVNGTSTSPLRSFQSRKVKDGEDLGRAFALENVMLGVDSDGDDITTLVVREVGNSPAEVRKKLADNQERLLRDILNVLASPDLAFDTVRPHGPDGATVQAVRREIVIDRLVERDALPSSERGSVTGAGRMLMQRTLYAAREAGRLGSSKEWVWLLL